MSHEFGLEEEAAYRPATPPSGGILTMELKLTGKPVRIRYSVDEAYRELRRALPHDMSTAAYYVLKLGQLTDNLSRYRRYADLLMARWHSESRWHSGRYDGF